MAVAITATQVDTYPPRVTLSVTGLTIGDVVTISRVIASVYTTVRGADAVTVTDTSFLAVDAELPFGKAITYSATVNGVLTASVGPTTYTLTGGKVAVSDAISGQSAEVVITAWPEKTHDRASSVFRVGGRTVVVSGERGMFTGQVSVMTETDSARENFGALLDTATDGVLQVRQAGSYGGVDCYVAVLSDSESRWSQDGTDQRRVWTLTVAETQAWAPELDAQSFTFADVDGVYTGKTFTQFDTDFTGQTFLQFNLVDWS